MHFEDLATRQKEKVAACKTPKGPFALAEVGGIELADARLESVFGGWDIAPECADYSPHACRSGKR